MSLASLLQPWSGQAFRHIPANSPFDVLDFRFAGRSTENRWNEAGLPTLYLAGDEGVLIAEWGRHFDVARSSALRESATDRAVYRFTLSVERLIDLRSPAAWETLSLTDAPSCFIQTGFARATAHFIRNTTPAQALLVPSVGFLDRLDHWCLVLFLEKLPELGSLISTVEHRGLLQRTDP